MTSRGSATAEYLGIVGVIALAIAGLLVVRPGGLGRTAPVRPIPAILRLIQAPARAVIEVRPVTPSRPRRPRPHRPRPRPPEVLLPTWLGGAAR